MSNAPIVVIGAGPVGLCLALRIAKAGAPVLVLEKRAALSKASKASTFHPPTLEMLHALGVWDVGGAGEVVSRVQFRDAQAGVAAEFDLATLSNDTRFPYRLHLEQAQLTPLLVDALVQHPHADLRFGVEAIGAEQTASGVLVHVKGGAPVEASLVVGADGARSGVRNWIGAAFEGADYPSRVLRLMTTAPLQELCPGAAPLTYLFNGADSCSFLKMSDCWRIILRVPAELSDEIVLQRDWWGRLLPLFFDCPLERLEPIEADVFAVGKRVAALYHSGRIFLVGDAAHITNTRGGMNMNCGIHDAWALGARLADVWRGGALETAYACAEERRNVATGALIPRTDRSVIGGGSWLEQVRALAADKAASHAYLYETSMLDMAERP